MVVAYNYHKAAKQIRLSASGNFKTVPKTFMTEKILGMHFKYHTQYNPYDGWRPPLHEPILVIGLWLNLGDDPLDMPLRNRLTLYKKFFPGQPFKLECSCNSQSQRVYDHDPLWRNFSWPGH